MNPALQEQAKGINRKIQGLIWRFTNGFLRFIRPFVCRLLQY